MKSTAPGQHQLLAARADSALKTGGRSTDAVYAKVIRQLEIERASGSLLDFGAGKGLLARALHDTKTFDRIVATDLIEYDLPCGVEFLRADLNTPLSLPDASFDVILAVGVLGALENPFQTCREWARLLKPNGLLVGTVVNIENVRSIAALLARGHFPGFTIGAPTRLPLGRATLGHALTMAAFEPPRWFYSDRGSLPLPATKLTWQDISRGRLRGLRFSNTTGFITRGH